MLIDFLLNMVYGVVVGFVNLFPSVSFSDSVSGSIATASTYISGLDIVLPVGTLVAVIGLVLGVETVILLIKIINWFIRKIPTIN
jgi:hypothetical protein